MKMKKVYMQPRSEEYRVSYKNSILAGSAGYVDPGTGDKMPTKDDENPDGGWASSKGNDGKLWED